MLWLTLYPRQYRTTFLVATMLVMVAVVPLVPRKVLWGRLFADKDDDAEENEGEYR